MLVQYVQGVVEEHAADVLIVPVAAGEWPDGDAVSLAGRLDAYLNGALASLTDDADFRGQLGRTLVVPTLGRLVARRLILVGLGERATLDAVGIRRAWGNAARSADEQRAVDIVSPLPPSGGAGLDASQAIASAAEAAQLATHRFTRYFGTLRQQEAEREEPRLRFVGDETADTVTTALERARAVVEAVALARDLVAEPASTLTPATMAERAEQVARDAGLECAVLGPDELVQHGAGAMLAVGKGSVVEPRLIHLVYRPEGDPVGPPVGLVGKCITFDTGGYSLKSHDGMLTMKSDMGGGAAVLGAMAALRTLGCRREVHGVICAAENMISGESFRPDDVLTAMNGVTIEIISTDAEGRLVLADGLIYAARQGVGELIDLATLTGAIEVALGDMSGLFASDDRLAADLITAAATAGEHTWRMPLIEQYTERLKSDVADLKNTGGRPAGAIIAALFLKHFTEGLPWAHFDIAGSALADKSDGDVSKGPTGTGVRTLLAYLLRPGAG